MSPCFLCRHSCCLQPFCTCGGTAHRLIHVAERVSVQCAKDNHQAIQTGSSPAQATLTAAALLVLLLIDDPASSAQVMAAPRLGLPAAIGRGTPVSW